MIRLSVTMPTGFALVYTKRELKRAMRRAGADVAMAARRLIRASARGGRKYGSRFASAPGDAPASQTGKLIRSIKAIPYRSGEGVVVKANAFYALFLEAGAKGGAGSGRKGVKGRRNPKRGGKPTGSRVLAPRPFLAAALVAAEPSIAARINASLAADIAKR